MRGDPGYPGGPGIKGIQGDTGNKGEPGEASEYVADSKGDKGYKGAIGAPGTLKYTININKIIILYFMTDINCFKIFFGNCMIKYINIISTNKYKVNTINGIKLKLKNSRYSRRRIWFQRLPRTCR